MFNYLTYEVTSGVCTVTFNRPNQLNAMNRDFMDEIIAAFRMANDDPGARVVVVTGAGRAFMAGADLKEYASQTDEEFRCFQERRWELYSAAEQSPKPYMAMVNGYAMGGGFEIVLACDIVVAAKSAVFGLPEVHLGLVPGGGGTQKLCSRIGLNRTMEVLMLGGRYSAEQMHSWGVVNYLADDSELLAVTLDTAQKLTRRLPEALAEVKSLARHSALPGVTELGMQQEARALSKLFRLPEVVQKLQDFINKNK